MIEVTVASLDARHRQLIENACRAWERGNLGYVLGATTAVLSDVPGCLRARKLQRLAQLRSYQAQGRAARALGWVAAMLKLMRRENDPARLLAQAESALARQPTNVAALQRLAAAAQALGWPETVVFALRAACELRPGSRDRQLALGRACLAANDTAEALRIADELLASEPGDAAAHELMRAASVANTLRQDDWKESGSGRDRLRTGSSAAVAGTPG